MAVIRDVRVKARLSVLSTELRDNGNESLRPGKERGQKKYTIDIPVLEICQDELDIRLEKAQQVLEYGYWVDPDNIPPQVTTSDVSSLTKNSVVLNGVVKSGTALLDATCGFKVGTTKELGTTKAAAESPVADAAAVAISYAWAGLTPGTTYYYRAYATDVNFSGGKYGTVRSFTTPLV